MELGLSLGNPEKAFAFLAHQKAPTNKGTLDFCMALGLNNNNSNGVEAPEKSQDSDEEAAAGGSSDEDNNSNTNTNTHLQLNLLSAPPLQISLPWSSDNGSSENGSSGLPAARRLNVNRIPATAEEVSSANSLGSPFGMYRNGNFLGNGNNKRDFELIGGNDVVDGTSRGSDDDENGPNGRKKLRLSKEQSAFLEESFKEHNTLNPKQKLALAKQLNLRPRQVEVWFQNRRARTKLKQTEVDCEYLKRCCETLGEENRRLHKELQELRALKSSNPFYMQSPATTLTMCPSCERVATTATPSGTKTSNQPVESAPKTMPFPLTTRPRFYPFSQSSSHSNQPTAS